LRPSSTHSTTLATTSSGSKVSSGSGTVWNIAFSSGRYSTASCSNTLAASPSTSQRLRSRPPRSADAVADWQFSRLNYWHMASTVKVSVRSCSSGTAWPERQTNQPKVAATAVPAISSTSTSSTEVANRYRMTFFGLS